MKKLLAILTAALLAFGLCACAVNITVDDADLAAVQDTLAAAAAPAAEAPDTAAPDAAAAPAASGTYVVTFSYGDTVELAAGEDLTFVITCSAPADMGPMAAGEEGSGVTSTSGVVTYSNVTLGGPNNYPTAETVTISGISGDCTVTITPNPDEAGDFPVVSFG